MKVAFLLYFSCIAFNSVFCEYIKTWGQTEHFAATVLDQTKRSIPFIKRTLDYQYPEVS